jgi:hypothetical protein
VPLGSMDIRRVIGQPALVTSDSARDKSALPADRIAAMKALLRSDTGARKELLRQVASDPTEADEMLTLVGRQLAMLLWADALSEFDMRDLTAIAGDIVDTATPDELWSW